MDEALTDLLEKVVAGGRPESPVIGANLIDNRSLKYRQRRKLERTYSLDLAPANNALDVVAVLTHARAAQSVRAELDSDDWSLLQDLAEGATFAAVAQARATAASTLKARTCRVRKHLRDGAIGTYLHQALAA
jgi:hypothetical protein